MIFPFLLALIAFLALLPILTPLMRRTRPSMDMEGYDQAVYRDQLHELDRDIARGLITETEAESARLEIQRRLLAADRVTAAPQRLARSMPVAVVVFLVVAGGGIGTYLWIGSPGIPDEPYASRTDLGSSGQTESTLQTEANKLAVELAKNPNDVDAWLRYAHDQSGLGDWPKAAAAYKHAMDLGRTTPDVVSNHAEMMVMEEGGLISPAAKEEFKQVLEQDPGNGLARYYIALAAVQAGEPRKAIERFQKLLAELPSDSPMRDQIAKQIDQAAKSAGIPFPKLAAGRPAAAPAPSANDVDNMTPAQRNAMIRGMVAKLAAKQEANPTNVNGWLQLGQAYAVLNEMDKAQMAYDKAAALRPGDISILLQEAQSLLRDQTPSQKLPPHVVAILKQVQAKAPDQPMVLWYLGLAAAQDGDIENARQMWQTLMKQVKPGTRDARMLQSAINALPAPKSP